MINRLWETVHPEQKGGKTMRKKSMSILLIACLLTAALLGSAPLLGNLWGAVGIAASVCGSTSAGVAAAAGGMWSGAVWVGIGVAAGLTGGVALGVGLGVVA